MYLIRHSQKVEVIKYLQQMNESDERGLPHGEREVLEARRDLRDERVDEGGVAHAHVGERVHDVVLHGHVARRVEDLAEGRDDLLGHVLVLEAHLGQGHDRQGLRIRQKGLSGCRLPC